MHFYEFITTELEGEQDLFVQQVIDVIKKDKGFPRHTSDPTQLAIYLYLKLTIPQTTAFQKLLGLYANVVPNHKLPELTMDREDMFLAAINIIVVLQNNDSRYKYN